ncbi:MAG: L,D-transpeptidase family protein [Gemmatimonadota bacterium]|nr:L,D-transpeptidase family protein [Gemmatimonadota bacterium]
MTWSLLHSAAGFTLALLAQRPDSSALARALDRYRALAADSSVPAFVPPARIVRPGTTLATARALRARLAVLGDLDSASAADSCSCYDGTLVEAVRRFQRRHGLEPDGVIGRATSAALAVPLAERADQLALALELIRQEPPVAGGPYIVVNVPAFRLFAYDGTATDTAPALDMKVVVGRARVSPTPSIIEELEYLDFWPYWRVPPSIVRGEMVPAMRRDSAYLRRHHLELVRGANEAVGDSVSPAVIDALRAGTLGLRQRRGPANALGRVKFVIPNMQEIYLHDTPERALFAEVRRDFSHGCIRVEHARELAIWAMRDHTGWTADSVDAVMSGPVQFRRVMLPRPIPVIVEYVTAIATPDGTVWFLPDIYGREAGRQNGW